MNGEQETPEKAPELADEPAASTAPDAERPRRFGGVKRELRTYFEFLALATLTISVPLFDTLQRNVNSVFISHHLGRSGTWMVALSIALGPAFALWLVEVAVGLIAPRIRRYAHYALVGAMIALLAAEGLARALSWPVAIRGVLAVAIGIGGAIAIWKWAVAGSYLRLLALAAPVFLFIFVTSAAIAPLTVESDVGTVSGVKITKPQRVVFIVVDELPTKSLLDGTGHVDKALFPNIAALAADSHWYRNNTSVAPYTDVAVPAILSGHYPAGGGVKPRASEYPQNLFTLLGSQYEINSHEINSIRLCPQSLCAQDQDVRGAMNDARHLWWSAASGGPKHTNKCACDLATFDEQLPLGRRFLSSLEPTGSKPRLDYMHVVMPHAPWRYLPSYQTYSTVFGIPRGLDTQLTWISDDTASIARAAHILQVQATDRLIGQVVNRLKSLDAYDNSLIVFTADHGVAFMEGSSYRSPDMKNYADVMWVPLMVKPSGNAPGTVDDRPARTIDALPTLADEIGMNIPQKIDGVALQRQAAPTPRKFMNWGINAFDPPKGPKYYSTYNEQVGFADVLKSGPLNSGAPVEFRPYGVGPYGSIVGQPVAALKPGVADGVQAIVNNRLQYRQVNPYAIFLPAALLDAGLGGRRQMTVAIALNGKIAAVVPTTPSLVRTPVVRAYLPPQLMRVGNNDVQFYEVTGDPFAPKLLQIEKLF